MRELRRVAETAVLRVEARSQAFPGALERLAREVSEIVGAAGLDLLQRLHQVRATLPDLLALRAVVVLDRDEHLAKRRHAVAALLRKIRARENRQVLIGRQKHRERPAARAAGEEVMRGLIDLVEVGPLFAIDLDVHVKIVHEPRRVIVLERLVRHHVTPVACGVADRKQNRFVLLPRGFERRFVPRLPVDGIIRVLQQVRARFGAQRIAHEHTIATAADAAAGRCSTRRARWCRSEAGSTLAPSGNTSSLGESLCSNTLTSTRSRFRSAPSPYAGTVSCTSADSSRAGSV